MTRLDELLYEMTRYDDKDVKRIQHFLKVHEFARLIGLAENLDPYTQEVLEAGLRACCTSRYSQCFSFDGWSYTGRFNNSFYYRFSFSYFSSRNLSRRFFNSWFSSCSRFSSCSKSRFTSSETFLSVTASV